MKTRVIAATVLLPVLLIILLVAPKAVTAWLFAFLCALQGWELLYATGLVRHVRLCAYSMIAAFLVPLWCHYGMELVWLELGILVFFGLLFGEMMLSHVKLRFERVSVCFVAGLLIPFMLSGVVRIMVMNGGRYLVAIPFVIAFTSDSGAYFVGKAFGRHKLSPVISPNKTVEGLVGGIACAMVGMLLYGLLLRFAFKFQVNLAYTLIYGLAGALGGVFGDLSFSLIKRQTGIKDYGNLIPGHGGVLDRFDSMTVIVVMVEILLVLLPAVILV